MRALAALLSDKERVRLNQLLGDDTDGDSDGDSDSDSDSDSDGERS